MSISDERIQAGEKFKNCRLSNKRSDDVKVPIGKGVWGGRGMSVETYIAIAVQSSLREATNVKFISMIKYTDVDKELACKTVCNCNYKQWESITRSINKMSKICEPGLKPVEVIRIEEGKVKGKPKYSNWIKLDFNPKSFGAYVVVPAKYVSKIMTHCCKPCDLLTYLTVLHLTQAHKPVYGLNITAQTYSDKYIDYSADEISKSLVRLEACGLIEAYDHYVYVKRKDGSGYGVCYKNVQTTPIDDWYNRRRDFNKAENQSKINVGECDEQSFIKLIPKNARYTIVEE